MIFRDVVWVLSAALVAAAPACRTDVPAQRPAAPAVAPEEEKEEADTDRDGVPDRTDVCPNDAEDKDGFEDADGCADLDNDQDRIFDAVDKCPNEPETYNGIADDDGCPDGRRVVPRLPMDAVIFDENSAKIHPSADAILDAIAATINGRSEFLPVTIAGHAAASEKNAPALAAARAEAIRRSLVEHGVPAEKIRVAPLGAGTTVCDQRDVTCHPRGVDIRFSGPRSR